MYRHDVITKRFGPSRRKDEKIVHADEKENHLKRSASFLTKSMYVFRYLMLIIARLQSQEVNPASASMITALFQLEEALSLSNVQKIVKEKFIPYDIRLRSVLVDENGNVAWKTADVDLNRRIFDNI
jgi:hypothetical protein